MKAQQSVLDQAQQGNAAAIGRLMQAPLSAKGITVNTHIKNGCLQVNLVADTCPPKNASLSFIKNGIMHLNPQGVRAVRIDGYQTGSPSPSWISRINLASNDSEIASVSPGNLQEDRLQSRNQGMGKKFLIALGLAAVLLLGVWAMMSFTNNSQEAISPTEEVLEP